MVKPLFQPLQNILHKKAIFKNYTFVLVFKVKRALPKKPSRAADAQFTNLRYISAFRLLPFPWG
jgi:hypothetical protein